MNKEVRNNEVIYTNENRHRRKYKKWIVIVFLIIVVIFAGGFMKTFFFPTEEVKEEIPKAVTGPEQQTYLSMLQAMWDGRFQEARTIAKSLKNASPLIKKEADKTFLRLSMELEEYADLKQFLQDKNTKVDEVDRTTGLAITGLPKQSINITESTSAELLSNRAELPMIEATVNGKPLHLIVDTGANFSVIAEDSAKDCGLDILDSKGIVTTSTSKTVDVRIGVADSLQLGKGVVFNKHAFLIVDRKLLEPRVLLFIKVFKADGIIGWNALRNLRTTFDKNNSRMIFEKPHLPNGKSRNFSWVGEPVIRSEASDGKFVDMFFDSGARSSYFTENILTKMKIGTGAFSTKQIGGVGGFEGRKVEATESVTLSIAGRKKILTGKSINYGQDPSCSTVLMDCDGLLGFDLVNSNGSLTIDLQEGIAVLGDGN